MFGLGMSEIMFLAVLALIVIGPKQLPELARTLGRFLNELKRSTNVLSDELKVQTRIDSFTLDDLPTRKKPTSSKASKEAKDESAEQPQQPEQLELPQQDIAAEDKKPHE
ncbi:Sec-independent protein translocase protein TatB [compost metagenome]